MDDDIMDMEVDRSPDETQDLNSIVSQAFEGGGDSGPSVDESFSSLITQLADKENINLFTELTMEEIRLLSALSMYEEDVMEEFIGNYVTFRVSRRRRGRKELVELARALGSIRDTMGEGAQGVMAKLRGGVR